MFLPLGTMFLPHGRMFSPLGTMFLPHGRMFLPLGRMFLPLGRMFLPHGRIFSLSGRMFPPHGSKFIVRRNVPFRRSVSAGSACKARASQIIVYYLSKYFEQMTVFC